MYLFISLNEEYFRMRNIKIRVEIKQTKKNHWIMSPDLIIGLHKRCDWLGSEYHAQAFLLGNSTKRENIKNKKYEVAIIKYTQRSRLWLFWLQPAAAPGYNLPDLQHRKTHTYANEIVPSSINPLKPELISICYLLALLGAHHFLHVSRIRVKLLTFRLLMSYIYIYIWSTHSWCF